MNGERNIYLIFYIMKTIKKTFIFRWNISSFLMLLTISLLTTTITKAQHIDECFLDSTALYNGLDSLQELTANSINGNLFTPKGQMKVLIIYAGFTNDQETGSVGLVWPYDDGINPPGKSFPNNTWDLFYDDYGDFSPSNTDNSISNYYYQMSLLSGNPLKMIAGVFPERINVPGTVNTSWNTYTNWVYDSIQAKYPGYDFSAFDGRTNSPQYQSDNSTSSSDNKIDFTIIIFRYSRNCATDPAGPSTLCNTSLSGNSIASILSRQFTDSLGSPTYSISGGYTTHPGFNGISKTTFLHEVAHTNYWSPHIYSANNAMGSYFYNNHGWGMMKNGGGPNVFECANAWERWYNGWIELTTDTSQVNTQIDSISDIQNGGVYTLRDFITTGDVIRVKLPHVTNQYLWLENHQGKNLFDNRDWWGLNGVNDTIPDAPRGLFGYIEGVRHARTYIPEGGASVGVNAVKHLHAGGNFDYSNPFLDPEPTAPEIFNLITYNFTKGLDNPLGAHNPLVRIRNNFFNTNPTQSIDYNSHYNGGGSLNENRLFNKENGVFTYGSLGIGMSFQQGDKLDLGSNPVITNLQTFDSTNDTLSPIFLNGISVEVLSFNQDSSMTVKIRMDDYDVDNSTRYTGNIILSPNIVSSNNYSLNIKAGKTLTIDKSGTPNKQHITANNDFINPTVFTCSGGSYFHLEQNAKVEVKNESTLRLKSGSKMELESGAKLHIFEDSDVIIEDGAELILKPGAILIIEEGATMYYNNNQSGKGLLVGATSISGNAARVEIKGNMIFDTNAVWTHNRDGYYYFYPNHQLTIPSTVVMNFTGKGKNHQMISLFANTTLLLENITATLNTGMIYYGYNTNIELNQVDLVTVASTYNPANNLVSLGIGLDINNPTDVFINGCDFNYLATGIKIEQATTPLTVQATNMTGMAGYNYYIEDVEEISITGGILDGGGYGIIAINTEIMEVTNTEIKNMETSGANLDEVAGAYFSNTKIHTNTNGIYSDNSLVFLRNGAKVYDNQNYGIEMVGFYNTTLGNFSSMLTIGDEGCGSVFDNATTGIKTFNTILNIDAVQHTIDRQDNDTIPNQFYDNDFMFFVNYNEPLYSPSQINAKGNYWGTNPPISSSEYTIIFNNCIGLMCFQSDIPLITNNYSTCYSSTTCMDCSSGTSSMMMSGGTSTVESVIQESFTEANQPFIEQDNATTRNAFLDLSSIDLIKDTVTDTWMGVSVNNQTYALTNKSVHHIQVSKAIKAKATNSNMRVNAVPKDIFAGITENANELANIQVYPNPVSNELNISHDLIIKIGAVYLEIMDVMGRVLVNKTINHTNNQIGISQLSSGLYFYNVLQNDKVVQSGKLVVE